MSTLKELKAELESLAVRVNEALEKQSTGDYVLSKQQMTDLIAHILKEAQERVGEQTSGMSIDDSHITLSLDYDNRIEIEMDEEAIVDDVVGNIDVTMSNEDIIDSVNGFLGITE